MPGDELAAGLGGFLAGHSAELIQFRRDLHAHPEIGYHEHRTTRRVALRLAAGGLRPMILPKGTGLMVEIGAAGAAPAGPLVALRADLDALPISDEKAVPYRSTVPNACHACGHDVHTTILLGTGLFLAALAEAGALPGRVRLIFQPAEEVPGGALDVLAAGGIAGVDRIFALHCDPRLDVGKIGIRSGPITAACDKITVRVTGPGGHTARPHLTADLVYALGKIVTELPAALTRRVDPRSSLSLVWGRVSAGSAANAIPDDGIAEGTVRCLDDDAWQAAPEMMKALIDSVASAYGVLAERQLRAERAAHRQRGGQRLDAHLRDAAGAGRPGGGRHAAEPRRRRLRLVPGVDPGRPGQARHQDARAHPSSTSTSPRSTSTKAPSTSGSRCSCMRRSPRCTRPAVRRPCRACPVPRTPDRGRLTVEDGGAPAAAARAAAARRQPRQASTACRQASPPPANGPPGRPPSAVRGTPARPGPPGRDPCPGRPARDPRPARKAGPGGVRAKPDLYRSPVAPLVWWVWAAFAAGEPD